MTTRVPIRHGGTGANNATDARVALDAAPSIAYAQANAAYAQANLAYAAANNGNLLLGGVITGTLNVTQDIIVGGNVYLEGNTTFINVATYAVEDSLIYLASNNSLTDSVDIGFMGGKNTGGTYAHTGLVRDATDAKWKLFDGLPEEGHVGNVVNFNNAYLATLVANVEANTLSVVNGVSGNVNFDAGTLFVDSVNNRVGVGTTNPTDALHIASGNVIIGANVDAGFVAAPLKISGTAVDVGLQLVQAMDNHGAPRLILSKSRGTTSSPTTVLTGDQTGSFRFAGYVGSTGGYVQNAQLMVEAEGTVSDTSTGLGGRITLWTRNVGGTVTERVRVDSNGNVAIGIANTTQRLYIGISSSDSVNGPTANSYPFARFMNHSSGSGIRGIEFGGPTGGINSPVYVKVAGTSARFSILNDSNVEQLSVLNDGNVGIGTTSPSSKLDVRGWVYINSTTVDPNWNSQLRVDGNATYQPKIVLASTNGYRWSIRNDDPTGNGELKFKYEEGPLEALTITRSGNVGIATTNPSAKLHVVGDMRIGAAATGGSAAGNLYIAGNRLWRWIAGYSPDYGVGNGFGLYDDTASAYRFVVDSNGNIGIGTASPSAKIHAYSASGSSSLYLQNGTAVTGKTWKIDSFSDGNLYVGIPSVIDVLTATPSGNVGIGTTSPVSKLDVVSSVVTAGEVHLAQFYPTTRGDGSVSIGYVADGTTDTYGFVRSRHSVDLGLGAGSATHLFIKQSGNIGIGTTNISVQTKLDVFETGGSTTWRSRILSRNDTADRAAFLGVYNGVAGVFAHNNALNGWATLYVNTVDGTSSAGGNVIMGGNVGIGSTNPGYRLDVNGTLNAAGTITQNGRTVSGPGSVVKQFYWNDLTASGTQARRFEIARLAIDYNDWNTGTGVFEVEIWEGYYSRGLKKRYAISWGYTDSSSIHLVEYTGTGENNFQCTIGTKVLQSGDNYYLPVYVDVKYYTHVDVRVTTNRDITDSSSPGIGLTYINSSPTPTNISDFSADFVVYHLSNLQMASSIINNNDGGVIIESNVSENNNWLWKENSKLWGTFYFNRGSQAGQTIGSQSTVGAETCFMGGSTGVAMPSGWTGYQSGSYIAAMISHANGYIYSASEIYAASRLSAGGKVKLQSSTGDIDIDGSINFLRGDSSYTTFIRAQNHPDQGYTGSGQKYWVELGSYGGTHVTLNMDGVAGSAENTFDHFTIWQAASNSTSGSRQFYVTNIGNVWARNNITAYSDERVKKDWLSLPEGFIEKLSQIKSGTFTRIDNGSRQAGVSAQSIREVLPEVVREDSDGLLSVAYGNAAMVSAVELAKEIVELKKQLAELREFVKGLK